MKTKTEMDQEKLELLGWLDKQAQDQYGEFGYSTCDTETQITILYDLVTDIMGTANELRSK